MVAHKWNHWKLILVLMECLLVNCVIISTVTNIYIRNTFRWFYFQEIDFLNKLSKNNVLFAGGGDQSLLNILQAWKKSEIDEGNLLT